MTGRRVLLVTPTFHGYWEAIARALARRGHVVRVHRYDASDRPNRRLENRLALRDAENQGGVRGRLGALSRARITDRTIRALRTSDVDVVLVVKGDLLLDSWWQAVAEAKLPTVLWLYDELERMSYEVDWLAAFAPIVTYSRGDVATLTAAGANAHLLPNAFDSLATPAPATVNAVTFIGARYPERERALEALAAAVPVRAYGREWSRHPLDVLRTGRREPPAAGIETGRDLLRAEYYGVMAGSTATLNVHGNAHEGFSMRTFEAPGVGAVQLIDRPDVDEYYEPGREVLVFESPEELVELAQRVRAEPAWARSIAAAGRARTLAEHTFVHRLSAVEELWG